MNKFALSLATPQINGVAFTGVNTLTAEDPYGNAVSFDASVNHVTIAADSPLTGAVSGLSGGGSQLTSAGDFSAGVADLTALGLKDTGNAGSGAFVATAATGGYNGTSASVAIGAGAAATISLTSGDSQSGTVGTALTSPFVVTVTDANGNPKSGTSVTFAVGTVPSGATGQSVSTTTTTTAGNAQASSTLTLGTKVGSYTVTATSAGLSGSPVTFNATGTAGAAARLAYTSVPSTGTAGTGFSVTVQSQDANGNPASPTSNTTITLTKATGGGTLSGTLTGTITTSGNSVSISGILYSKPDTMTLTATPTVGETGLSAVTSSGIVFSAGSTTPTITGVVNQTNAFGTATLTLTGIVSAAGPTYPPVDESGTISATINGLNVTGTFTNGAGAFVIYIDDAALASDGVSGSPYTITYAYAGDSGLSAAADNTETTLTVLPALTGTSEAGALDGYTAATIPVTFVTKNASGITYSNVVLATTATDDHKQFTITVGVPPGTTSVRIKPRFYLSRVFHFDPPTTADDTAVTISGVTFFGGDADSNDQVDGTDYAWIRALWSSSAPLYDVNGDGKIDANDFPKFSGGTLPIGAADYEILKNGWYQTGDPE